MINLQDYIEAKLHALISSWDESGIYAISFLVQANESYTYNGHSNVPEFSVSYNTEKDCQGAAPLSEARWNYAFWRQNETYIIEADVANEGIRLLFNWYEENGIDNVGYEDTSSCYVTIQKCGISVEGLWASTSYFKRFRRLQKDCTVAVLSIANSAGPFRLSFMTWNIPGIQSRQPKRLTQRVKQTNSFLP